MRIEPGALVAEQQLLEDLVVHGKQPAIALVELLALPGQVAELLPVPRQGSATLARVTGQQALHAGASGVQAEGGEHLAATLSAGGKLFDAVVDLRIDALDLGHIAL